VSKIETGKQTTTTEDVTAWATAVGAAPQVVEDLIIDLRTVRFEYASWRRQLRAGMAPRPRVSGALEASATIIRALELDCGGVSVHGDEATGFIRELIEEIRERAQ